MLILLCSATFQAKKKLELKIVRRKKYIQATARLNQSLNRGGVQMKDLYQIPCLRSSSVSSFKTFFWFSIKMDCTDFYHNHNFDRESH